VTVQIAVAPENRRWKIRSPEPPRKNRTVGVMFSKKRWLAGSGSFAQHIIVTDDGMEKETVSSRSPVAAKSRAMLRPS
jgi:hypothetical protein